ncbi:MAG: hypothetical protein AB7I27_13085 [Bacteriovoracaceae bacterium]
MKSIRKALILASLSIFIAQNSFAVGVVSAALAGTTAAQAAIFTTGCSKGYEEACDKLLALTALGAGVAVTVALMKEVQEVKPEALAFAAEGSSSAALESTVEKIQAEALAQGKELSFEEVVDLINNL